MLYLEKRLGKLIFTKSHRTDQEGRQPQPHLQKQGDPQPSFKICNNGGRTVVRTRGLHNGLQKPRLCMHVHTRLKKSPFFCEFSVPDNSLQWRYLASSSGDVNVFEMEI